MKLTRNELIERAADTFTMHPTVETFYATSDGLFFLKPGQAQEHAKAKGLTVEKITRAQAEPAPINDVPADPEGDPADKAPKKRAPRTPKTKAPATETE